MGKKGKRSKRRQAKKVDTDRSTPVLDNILNRVKEYDDKARKSSSKRLYSDSISTLKEALQFIEPKKAIIVKAAQKEMIHVLVYEGLMMRIYRNLMTVEYSSCNYEEVIQIYNCFASKFDIAILLKEVKSNTYLEEMMFYIMMYHNLALIRIGNDVCADSFIFQDSTDYMETADIDSACFCKEQIVNCLRASKNFYAAMDIDNQFLSIRNLDKEERVEQVAASLAVTLIEKYRVEFRKHTKKENEQEFGRITQCLPRTPPKQIWETLSAELQRSFPVAIAQCTYLFSKTVKREHKMWTEVRRQAIYSVRIFISTKWQMKDNCFYCHQAPTKDEVKYVCGDCRVACYCSIDHQRSSWKKNALQDMCFGHEAICPAMKAYRKWQEAVDGGDIEKEKKMERRLGRECLGFLAYGLGLENKCYDIEEVE